MPKPKWFGILISPKPAKVGELGVLTPPKPLLSEHKLINENPKTYASNAPFTKLREKSDAPAYNAVRAQPDAAQKKS